MTVVPAVFIAAGALFLLLAGEPTSDRIRARKESQQ